jgi:hypothetical protein
MFYADQRFWSLTASKFFVTVGLVEFLVLAYRAREEDRRSNNRGGSARGFKNTGDQ